MEDQNGNSMTIFHTDIVILAAGGSSRLGRPKQLLAWQGKNLLQHAVQTALEITTQPVVVTGAHADQLVAAVDASQVQVVFNPEWEQGIASSIRCGLQALLNRTPTPGTGDLYGLRSAFCDVQAVIGPDLSAAKNRKSHCRQRLCRNTGYSGAV